MNDQAQRLRHFAQNLSDTFPPDNAAAARQPDVTSRCTSLAVTSGKGGVGKSTISVSLAIALAKLKKSVCVVDADIGLANIHLLLGLAPRRNLSHVVNEECLPEDIIAMGPAGIHVLPGASGIERLANIDPLRLNLLQRKLARLEQRYDFLVIDTGAGIGKTTTEFAAKADMAVVVVTPEPTSLADAYAMIKVLYEKKVARLSVLVNRAITDAEGKETFDKLNALVVKFLKRPLELIGIAPLDNQATILAKRQKLSIIENPRSLFAVRIGNCARKLSGVRILKNESFFARLLNV